MIRWLIAHSSTVGNRGAFDLPRVIHHRVVAVRPLPSLGNTGARWQQTRENQGRHHLAQKEQVPGGQKDRDTPPI